MGFGLIVLAATYAARGSTVIAVTRVVDPGKGPSGRLDSSFVTAADLRGFADRVF